METPVPWKRLWRRLDVDSKDEPFGDGFLQSWEDIFGFRSFDGPKLLEELLDVRCLVLCGEPGMGKSTAVELCRNQIEEKTKQIGRLYWRSFREAISPEYLLTDLTSSPQWAEWLNGKELTIVIDALDEGLALASNVVSVLVADLRGKPVERLKLVLVCRDAEWPFAQGRALMKLWPTDQRGRFQLQRLRAGDAEQALRHWGVSESDADAFMAAVRDKAAEAFAARPITLRMLAEEFKTSRQLSGTRLEIFRRACVRLCREDPERAKIVKKATRFEFNAEQILPVVKKIAALMLLGGYGAVSRTPAHFRQLDIECMIPSGAGERERARLEAALGCALFCDAGNQSRAFALQSYAEFLAAEFLAEFPLAQVLNLLCIHESGQRFVVPQLAELSAWLALQHSDFLDWLISHEPEILLRNDASCLTESQRSHFVEALLRRMACEEAFDDWDLKRFYGSFRHSGLAGQLRPYLKDKGGGRSARRAAIHLAGLGKLSELFEELLAITKDATEDTHLREQAMGAVVRFIRQRRLVELEPFARCEVGADPHDELRGDALKALVPHHWKVSQALPALATPANENFVGEFRIVCENHLPSSIELDDLPRLLASLVQFEHPFEGNHNRVRPTACRALALAAQNLEEPRVAEAFLTLVRAQIRQQQLPFGIDDEQWTELVEKTSLFRRQLASVFVGAHVMTVDELSQLLAHRFIPLAMEDCLWVLQQLELASVTKRPLWARLARSFWPNVIDSPYREPFFEACEGTPELAFEVQWPCIVHLNSEGAKHARELVQMHRRREQKSKNKPPKPTAEQLFEATLAAAKNDWRNWRKLSWELQRSEDGGDAFGVNLNPISKHRWLVLTRPQREAVTECARAFLLNAAPTELAKNIDDELPLEVTWALWLLRDRCRSDSDLQRAVMNNWFDALFAQPFPVASEEQELAKLGVSLDPRRAAVSFGTRLQRIQSGKLGMANVLAGFELTWTTEFTQVLVGFINSQGITGVPLRNALEFLARHDSRAAEVWLAEKVRDAAADVPTILASALVLFPAQFWEEVKSQFAFDKSWAEASLQLVADLHATSVHKPLEKLIAEQLGDLFLMLEGTFSAAIPVRLTGQDTSSRERIEKLRWFIPQRLQELASSEGCRELLRLADAVPHWRTTLRWHWRDGRLALLRNSWPGVPLDIILGIAAKRESRWVVNADDLLELLVEAISRFQDELNRTEFPEARDLWNESPELCPKDESALTQKLIRWLRDYLGPKNGIALGCQVNPSPVHETDIEVWARPGTSTPTGETFVVTIEVKCSFNREVATSLEMQLVAEYLLKLGRKHGIYLVGWYRGEGWKPLRNPLGAQTWQEANSKVDELLTSSRNLHPQLNLGAVCLDCEFPQAFRKHS